MAAARTDSTAHPVREVGFVARVPTHSSPERCSWASNAVQFPGILVQFGHRESADIG